MENNLDKAILSLLSFYAIFQYPLSEEEVWQYLLVTEPGTLSYDLPTVAEALRSLLAKGLLSCEAGLYALETYEKTYLELRRSYYLHYYWKLKKARFWARIFSYFPGIRLVALVNSVALQMPKPNSDLDFLIITDSRSLWISRFLLTGFLKLFLLRPRFVDDKDALCTSFWLSDSSLDLQNIQSEFFDVYLLHWLSHVLPLYDAGNYYQNFMQANAWQKKYFPNLSTADYQNLLIHSSVVARFLKKCSEFFWLRPFWQRLSKKFQMNYFPADIKTKMNQGNGVIVNDNMLKFHSTDNREKFYQSYINNLNNLLNKYRYVSKS